LRAIIWSANALNSPIRPSVSVTPLVYRALAPGDSPRRGKSDIVKKEPVQTITTRSGRKGDKVEDNGTLARAHGQRGFQHGL
jgi:hypothetical protein